LTPDPYIRLWNILFIRYDRHTRIFEHPVLSSRLTSFCGTRVVFRGHRLETCAFGKHQPLLCCYTHKNCFGELLRRVTCDGVSCRYPFDGGHGRGAEHTFGAASPAAASAAVRAPPLPASLRHLPLTLRRDPPRCRCSCSWTCSLPSGAQRPMHEHACKHLAHSHLMCTF
jgi:hypothetical protein